MIPLTLENLKPGQPITWTRTAIRHPNDEIGGYFTLPTGVTMTAAPGYILDRRVGDTFEPIDLPYTVQEGDRFRFRAR